MLDVILIFLSTLAFLPAVYVFTPNSDHLHTSHPLATLKVEGSAQSRHAESLEWRIAKNGAKLYARDIVVTGAETRATLKFTNGDRVELSPNSLMQLDESVGDNYHLTLVDGSASVNRQSKKFAIKGKGVEITSHASTVTVTRREATATITAPGESMHQVSNSVVQVEMPRQATPAPPDKKPVEEQTLVLNSTSTPAPEVPSLTPVKQKEPDQTFLLPSLDLPNGPTPKATPVPPTPVVATPQERPTPVAQAPVEPPPKMKEPVRRLEMRKSVGHPGRRPLATSKKEPRALAFSIAPPTAPPVASSGGGGGASAPADKPQESETLPYDDQFLGTAGVQAGFSSLKGVDEFGRTASLVSNVGATVDVNGRWKWAPAWALDVAYQINFANFTSPSGLSLKGGGSASTFQARVRYGDESTWQIGSGFAIGQQYFFQPQAQLPNVLVVTSPWVPQWIVGGGARLFTLSNLAVWLEIEGAAKFGLSGSTPVDWGYGVRARLRTGPLWDFLHLGLASEYGSQNTPLSTNQYVWFGLGLWLDPSKLGSGM